jgi:NAD(P)H-dependent FMN reductase
MLTHLFLALATFGLFLEHLLDDLLLLDQEGPDDAVPDAVGASRAAVRTLDGLLGVRDLRVLAGSKSRDL